MTRFWRILAALVATSLGAVAVTFAVPAQAGSPSVTLTLSAANVFAGDSFRARLTLSGAASTCALQSAPGNSTRWTTLHSITLRAGRTVDWSISSADWRLGSIRVRALCGSTRDVKSIAVLVPPDWDQVSVAVPGLTPSFEASIADYVVRQTDGAQPCAFRITATAPNGLRIGIDGRPPVTGSSGRNVVLTPGQRTQIRILRGGAERIFSIRCLPANFPDFVAAGHGSAQWYLGDMAFGTAYQGYAYVVDKNGTPVWWYDDTDGRPTSLRLWTHDELTSVGMTDPYAVSWMSGPELKVSTLGGEVVSTGWNTDRHDIQPSGNGTTYAIRYVTRPCATDPSQCADMTAYGGGAADKITDGQIVELAPDGTVLWTWNTRDHIPLSATGNWLNDRFTGAKKDGGVWDIIHLNSVAMDGPDIIVSARNLNSVFKIDRATGDIVWRLGGTASWASANTVNPPKLVVDANGFDVSQRLISGQHDARLLPNGDLTLHDNGTMTMRKARVLRFQIDGVAGTAKIMEALTDPALTRGSACCGSTRKLASGNWITAWGADSLVSELQADGTSVFSLTYPGNDYPYRIVPVEDGVVPADAWRSGMDAMHPRN